MYEEDIRELKSQIDLKNDQITKLQQKNKDLREKYETKKSESRFFELFDRFLFSFKWSMPKLKIISVSCNNPHQ